MRRGTCGETWLSRGAPGGGAARTCTAVLRDSSEEAVAEAGAEAEEAICTVVDGGLRAVA